jgi:hypothetical protein
MVGIRSAPPADWWAERSVSLLFVLIFVRYKVLCTGGGTCLFRLAVVVSAFSVLCPVPREQHRWRDFLHSCTFSPNFSQLIPIIFGREDLSVCLVSSPTKKF